MLYYTYTNMEIMIKIKYVIVYNLYKNLTKYIKPVHYIRMKNKYKFIVKNDPWKNVGINENV